MPEAQQTNKWAVEGSSSEFRVKKEEVPDEDFAFDEPCLKKQKTSGACRGQATALPPSGAQSLRNELNMNWDLKKVCRGGMFVFMFFRK